MAFVNPRYERLEIAAAEQEAAMRRIERAVEDERHLREQHPRWAQRLQAVALMQEAAVEYERHRHDPERAAAVLRAYGVPLAYTDGTTAMAGPIAAPMAVELIRRQRDHKQAQSRARGLFITFLDPTQRRYFEAGLPIVHEGKAGRYILGARGNLIEAWLLATTRFGPPGRYLMCVGPAGPLPQPDVFLTQLLWLRHDEATLLQTANAAPHPG